MLDLERRAGTAAHWSEADYRRLLASEGCPTSAQQMCAGGRVALVIEEEGIRGFIIARALGKEWEIENLAVAGEARRGGLATRLVSELLERARADGAKAVLLEVRESNVAARQLYEKWAFEQCGRRRGYYSEPSEDAVLYRYSFPPGTLKSH